MPDVRFYHLSRQTAQQALPALLEKTVARGWRAVVRVENAAALEALDSHLWRYRADAFLPHVLRGAAASAASPIVLAEDDGNPDGAEVLFLVNAPETTLPNERFTLVADLFDGNDAALADAARARWQGWRAQGEKPTYWQQGEKGWSEKK